MDAAASPSTIPAADRIVRVLSVRDTREYEEINDRWVPIPGSGTESECSRCGRFHEVHAEVLLGSGRTAIVGTGCASRNSMDSNTWSTVRSLDRAAKRAASLRAEIAALVDKLQKFDAAARAVEALPLPEIQLAQDATVGPVATMGEERVYLTLSGGQVTPERRTCLIESWRRARLAERGFAVSRYHYSLRLTGAQKAAAKLQKSHPELVC